MTAVVQQGGEHEWRGPTHGADYAGAELNADDNDISGWHGGIIWTDEDYELQRGDNNTPNLVADVCRCLFSCSVMPVPRWRGVRTGSEVLSQEDAAKIFGPSSSFAYSHPVHPVHTRRERVASLPPCRLYGAPIQRANHSGQAEP